MRSFNRGALELRPIAPTPHVSSHVEGDGDMAVSRARPSARDAKVLQIYGGTHEIQIFQIARSLGSPS